MQSNPEALKVAENIENNILKIFEKCEGLIFNSETVKNSYDAKDILVIVTEYNPQLRLQALQISIKLISHFLNDNKNYFLKNANTILFYSLKNFSLEKAQKIANNLTNSNSFPIETQDQTNFDTAFPNNNINPEDNNFKLNDNTYKKINKNEEAEIKANIEILNYFKSNSQIFKNLFYSLLKRDFTNNAKAEEIVFISELISNFLIKTETSVFGESEIKNIFDFIFSVWKNADEDTENSLSTCIVALTSKFEFLENYKTINLFFQAKIDYLLKMLRNKLEQINCKNTSGEHLCSECLCVENENGNLCRKNFNSSKSLPEKFKLDISEFNYKEINKYLNLFIKFFTVEKISSFVLQEYFNVYLKIKNNLIFFYEKLNQKFFAEAEKRLILTNKNDAMKLLSSKVPVKSANENDVSMEINETDFQNLQIKEEEKIYNLIILLYKNISENIQKIINQNIRILNLKTDSNQSANITKSKKGGCCGGKEKKAKSQNSGCCGGSKQTSAKSGCCGGAKQSQNGSDSEEDDKLIKIEIEKEKKSCAKSYKKGGGKCSKKNKKTKSAEEENSELILKNNSSIIFQEIKNLININLQINNNDNMNDNENNKSKSDSIIFFFEIFDTEIFQTSLVIIENYLNSEFIDNAKKTDLMNLVIKILKKLNAQFSVSQTENKNKICKLIQYCLIFFDAQIISGNRKDSFFLDPEFKNYFSKIKNSYYLKFLLKITKIFLNTKYENTDIGAFNSIENTNKLTKHKNKLKNLLVKKEGNLSLEIALATEIQALSYKIQNLIESETAKVYFEINSAENKNEYLNESVKKYFSSIYMLSLESELVSKLSDSSSGESINNNKISNLTESEKQNLLIFSYQNLQQENFIKEFSIINLNLYKTLIHFTKLNKLAYKLNGFLYFSLYNSLKNYFVLQSQLASRSKKPEDKMDIEETSLNIAEKKNSESLLNLIQAKLKEIYDDFLTSFEKVLAINKNFKSIILKNLNEQDAKETLNFNVFANLDAINKFSNFLNYICLINDKNVLEILDKLMEKLFNLCNDLRDFENYLKKENSASLNLLNFYFSNALFVKILNGNANFDNINNPYITINSEISKEKLKVNFLKFNKNIYEKSFDKSSIFNFLSMFKKNSEMEKHLESETKGENYLKNFSIVNKIEEKNFKAELMQKAFDNAIAFSSDSNIYKALIAKFILNFYLNFDFETLQENIDIILDHTLKFLSVGICLEKAAKSLKNIIQYVGKNFLQRKGYNLQNIIENLVKVLFIF
jgi:hypothetical protein